MESLEATDRCGGKNKTGLGGLGLGVGLGGVDAGAEFYTALLANAQRWDTFVERGAILHIPDVDIRYAVTASSLLTMYMNTDRGLRPQYRHSMTIINTVC